MDGSLVSYVNITDLSLQDGGSYQCQATNDVGISNHEARIDVIGRPYIRPMKNLTVVTGRNIEVRCPVSGYPIEKIYFKKAAPVLSPISFPKNLEEGMRTSLTCTVLAGDPPISLAWFKDGQPIQHNNGNTRVVTISEYIISLVVDSVHRRHSGNYTCIASNMAASVNTTANMVVRASPRWRLKPIGTSTVLGQMVRLECQASGQPNPVIRWKYSKEENSPDYENVISGPHKHVLENGSLSITGVLSSDSGYYLCEADNGVGSPLTETVQLQVHVPPRIEGGGELIEVKKSREVSLSCSSYGDDPLALTWTKNGEAVYEYPESRYKILDLQDFGSIKLSTLRITSVERKDSTVFTCIASNPYGTDSKTFDVIVKEIPDPPSGIKVNRVTSTTVALKWSEPYAGNSAITSYTIAYRTAKEEWSDSKRELTAPASQNSATISGLEPRTTYYFTVTAENSIGISNPGKEVKFTTGIEAPRSIPSDVTAVTVDTSTVQLSWDFPQGGQSSDVINGFYVGYKEYGQKGPYNLNRTVYANSTDRKWKILIRNLKRWTRYSFVVQAFNDQGPGSVSQEVVARTFEFDPPHTPILRIAASTSTSLRLAWQLKTEENTPARGFVLNYKEGSNAWKDIEISPDLNSYILDNLRCGAAYQAFLTAFNDVGRSDPSDVIKVTLKGNEPKAPEMRSFITTNSSAATLNLQAWKDGGCRLQYFVIQYKPQSHREWILLSNHVIPDQKRVVISDLHPGTWYDLLVTALNDAGTTEAEYRFATLTLTGATIPPIASADTHRSSFIKDPAILVPIVCAIFVLLVIVIVTSLVIVWRRRDGSGERGSDAVSRNSGGREDNISMSSYGKTKSNTAVDNQREPLYYPSPYATTHIAAETGDRINHATIRRTRNRPSDYTYDVPHRQVGTMSFA
ncbi:Down syndrome cell adhesion molecule homolog [Limulus polyphemus]|uniref:Down syndrome cell adhesion molecule homolog n=1 Tax=Limulus polyphemus TaxID=6850 RepID=A0ABM1TQD8_LIMPO|nr:Down syndrome cell adhesion molecule homolog [Limulus polyphemus]